MLATEQLTMQATAVLMSLGLSHARISDTRAEMSAVAPRHHVAKMMVEAMRADAAARNNNAEQVESALIEVIALSALCLLDLADARPVHSPHIVDAMIRAGLSEAGE